MLQNELVVCFSTLSWDYLRQRHHELMIRFARAGNRVLYVEPIGIRMPGWQDRHRIVARLRNRQKAGPRGIRQVMENLWVVDPLVNPFQQVGFVHWRNVANLARQVARAADRVGGGRPIVWTYVPTPLAREVIRALDPKLLVYDCVDALTENPKGVFSSFAESERELSRRADLVLASSPELVERQRALNKHTYYVPHGVDYQVFATAPAFEPSVLSGLGRPRLVFFGGIDERVDYLLLKRLATAHPDWQLVLMGIVRTDISDLTKLPNVLVLGHIPHAELAGYLYAMDVLLLPYVKNEFSRYINPAKLYECLAVGKPTIATALPVFDDFKDVLAVASDAAEFERLAAQAVAAPLDEVALARRRERARANTWDMRFDEIMTIVQERLADV
ncbi:MAG: glycosyltransferase [Anaerolineae bacterium]|nr:glycosyltransferase [Anaerolineae bacterium]